MINYLFTLIVSHSIWKSHSVYCKRGVGYGGSDCFVATLWTGQRGSRYTALPELSDISYPMSPAKRRNQCRPSLHAEKHVAVSAGGKLRLEGKKTVAFSLCYWEGDLKKHTHKNPPYAQERDLVFNMLKLWPFVTINSHIQRATAFPAAPPSAFPV